jgi:hypothetical protein
MLTSKCHTKSYAAENLASNKSKKTGNKAGVESSNKSISLNQDTAVDVVP